MTASDAATWRPPFRDGQVHVLADRCSTCVFRPGNLMHLSPGRLAELVRVNLAEQSALTCHKTLRSTDGPDGALCRGFVDAYTEQSLPLRVARDLGVLAEDPCP